MQKQKNYEKTLENSLKLGKYIVTDEANKKIVMKKK